MNQQDDSTAWLIERKLDGGNLYIGRNGCLVSNADAIRFSRAIDAKRMLETLEKFNAIPRGKHFVAEHVWIGDKQ